MATWVLSQGLERLNLLYLLRFEITMENWEIDFEWLRVQNIVKGTMSMDKLPDLQTVLFLIGIQELGQVREKFTKEEKQDLMHIAVCRLMSQEGYFRYSGRDDDGWPHYDQLRSKHLVGVKEQETYLKSLAIRYFGQMENENGEFDI